VLFLMAACGGNSSSATTGNGRNPAGAGPAAVSLGSAGDPGAAGSYVVLAKSGISSVPGSAVTGDMGLSPAAASFVTGFALIADSTNVFATSTQVSGQVFAANYAVPSPINLTTAIGSMEGAYSDAASRPTPDFLALGTGNIRGQTLVPGLDKRPGPVPSLAHLP